MVRLLGLGRKREGKKRLSPTPLTPQPVRETHPMYQYALDEYAQAVAPGSSNDDGRMTMSLRDDRTVTTTGGSVFAAARMAPSFSWDSTLPAPPSTVRGARVSSHDDENKIDGKQQDHEDLGNPYSKASGFHSSNQLNRVRATRSPFENDMADATYEEVYGEAYVGGTIKYVYPSGYQSMRPRSCPWKLSIVVCLLFTWLSIFIVGHCSDQIDDTAAYDTIDDDTLAIDIRWCGSRPLYLMWVASMLVTGVSAAYCSVIGYIKVRDFAVANSRSQPPGVSDGKSDYYVRIEDGKKYFGSGGGSDAGSSVYRPSIYQSDGTPQFWGSHIYRPTQAAVAVTSR